MKNLGMFFSGRKGAPSLAAHFYVQAPWGMLSTHGRWGGPPQLNFSGGVNNAMFPYLIGAIIGIVIGLAVGVPVGIQHRKKSAEREIGSAEDEAKRIINEAYKSAESKRKPLKPEDFRGFVSVQHFRCRYFGVLLPIKFRKIM